MDLEIMNMNMEKVTVSHSRRALAVRVVAMLVVLASLSVASVAAQADPTSYTEFTWRQSTTQAGSHPDVFINTKFFNSTSEGVHGSSVKQIVTDLPTGWTGNNLAVPRCSAAQFASNPPKCPTDSQVGTIHIYLGVFAPFPIERVPDIVGYPQGLPVYNLTVPGDKTARLGFWVLHFGTIQVFTVLEVHVRTESDYGLTTVVPNIPRAKGFPLYGSELELWGVPGDASHDAKRALPGCTAITTCVFGVPSGSGRSAFITLGDVCNGPGVFSGSLETYQSLGITTEASAPTPALTGCGAVPFSTFISTVPQSTRADTPTGLTVETDFPQTQNSDFPAASDLRDATVTLPAGLSIAPGAANGLTACADSQLNLGSEEPGACPDSSKIGSFKFDVAALPDGVSGGIYIGTQESDDPQSGKMYRMWLVGGGNGVNIKIPMSVIPDPVTGQLTAYLKDLPQAPVLHGHLVFQGGTQATLATPLTCGPARTDGEFVPWSGNPGVLAHSTFAVDWDGAGGACPSTLPFSPGFSAGTVNPHAGAFTPFTMRLTRDDRQRTIAGLTMNTPPGMLGMLKNVTQCPEPQAALGTCGEDSLIGHVNVGAGPGLEPTYVQGKVFLTGPYHGSPFGLSVVVHAAAGPFDLGIVVVRGKIEVSPGDAHLIVIVDPLPLILKGVPLRLRSINVTIDRPNFIFNPTKCSPMTINAIVGSGEGASGTIVAPNVATSDRFQASDCAALPFAPKFAVSTNGHTSRANGASLRVKLTLPTGAQANIAKVKVNLPKQLPSRLTTLQKACADRVFNANPASCPAASRIGYAVSKTPLLANPLIGPVYFVSHGGAAFPDLVIILQGEGIRVDIHGDTNISKAGITSTSFKTVPDVPVSSFELTLPQGPVSALAANGNLCAERLRMPTSFIAQNGTEIHQITPITATGCGASSASTRSHHKARQATGKRSHVNTRHGQ